MSKRKFIVYDFSRTSIIIEMNGLPSTAQLAVVSISNSVFGEKQNAPEIIGNLTHIHVYIGLRSEGEIKKIVSKTK